MHHKKTFLFTAIMAFCAWPLASGFANTVRHEKIAVIVNDNVITTTDIDARMKLIMTSSGLPDQPEVREKVRTQVTNMLIEEKIKTGEAARLKLSVDDTDINDAIATIAAQNKMTSVDFQKMFQARGINILSLRNQIQAQILWSRVVARQIRPQITIYDRDIDTELQRLTRMVGQTEYAISEILLPTDRPATEKNSRELAEKMIPEIKKNPQSFLSLARQFSKAPGAATGGFIGWVTADQLDPDVRKFMSGAKIGSVLGPFKTYTGLHIILVRDIRTRRDQDLPTRDDIQKTLFMDRLERLQNQYYLDLRSAAFIKFK